MDKLFSVSKVGGLAPDVPYKSFSVLVTERDLEEADPQYIDDPCDPSYDEDWNKALWGSKGYTEQDYEAHVAKVVKEVFGVDVTAMSCPCCGPDFSVWGEDFNGSSTPDFLYGLLSEGTPIVAKGKVYGLKVIEP